MADLADDKIQADSGAIVQHDPEDPLKDPRQRYVIKLLATGYSQLQAAKTSRISYFRVRRWCADPLFAWELKREKEEMRQIAETAKDYLVPQAIAVAAAELNNADLKIRMKAQSEIRKWHIALKPVGPQVAIQNNTQILNQMPPALDPPKVRDTRTFVVEDLGRAEEEFYPRVMFLLEQIDRPDVREVILMTGKGSGKTFLASLAMARLAQRILVHENPARAYGQATGQLVGVINLSVTQSQAQLAVFRNFVQYIQQSQWFQRYAPDTDIQTTQVKFPKNVLAYCGNSSAKGVEGINWVYGVADEVCRLPEVGMSGDIVQRAVDLVNPVRNTMNTRFPKDRKLILASWPEHNRDYLHLEIEKALTAGVKEDLTARFEAVPVTRGTPDEEEAFQAQWRDEPFRKYKSSVVLTNEGVLIVKCPLWAMKPDCNRAVAFREWQIRSHDFACQWAAAPDRADLNPYFRDPEAFKRGANLARKHPIKADGTFEDWFQGSGEYLYYAHIDIGVKHDAAGIAVGHYDNGRCVYDLHLEVKPSEVGGEIRIRDLRRYLYDMEKRGFTFGKVTQDGFEGLSSKQELEDHGIASDIHSVDRNRASYDTWLEAWYDGNLDYYPYEPLFECVKDLIVTSNGKKIDHVTNGKKDCSDASAAVCYHVFEAYGGYVGKRRG